MPELAFVFFVGVLTNLTLTGLFVFLSRRRYETLPYATLRLNLQKVGLFWSENQERLVLGGRPQIEADRRSAIKTILIAGSLLTFFSWVGAIFQFVLMLSYQFFVRSRIERELLNSPLAKNSLLNEEQIQSIIAFICPGTP